MFTQEKLKELLHYDPETGHFIWLKNRGGLGIKGEIAGITNVKGYIRLKILGKPYLAHRVAFFYMTGKWPVNQVDHINRIKNDNRWSNLRDVTNSENQFNTNRNQKYRTTGIEGITLSSKKFVATIHVDKHKCYLGLYEKLEDAISVVDYAKKRIFENNRISNDYILGQLSI